MSNIKLIAGTSHYKLAEEISFITKIPLTPVTIKKFADGEIYVRVKESIRGDDIFVIQSICPPVNDNLMETLILLDSLRRAGSARINVVCPYLGYSRQDRKAQSREPITAKLVANMLTAAGAHRLVVYDLHAEQIQGFYDIAVSHFWGFPLFAQCLQSLGYEDMVIVSPDVGGVKRANRLADQLRLPLAIIDKVRSKHNESEIAHVVGEVEGKTAVILDDMIDTGGSITNAAKEVKRMGAKKVVICASHGLLNNDAKEKLEDSPAEKIILLNTLPLPNNLSGKFMNITVAPVLSEAIMRVHENRSLSELLAK